MSFLSVNQIVRDVENAFINNIDSQEKVSSFEQVFKDFALLQKMYSKLQTDPQSVRENGLFLINKIIMMNCLISVPEFNLRSLLSEPEVFITDLQNFLVSKNVTIDNADVVKLTQLNFQLEPLGRGKLESGKN